MNRSRLYITLNRSSEWQRGLLCGMDITQHSVRSCDGRTECTMITGSSDSTEHGFIWRSLEISADISENTIMRVSAYAADSTFVSVMGKTVSLDAYLNDSSVSCEERLKTVGELFVPLGTDTADIPINLTGRYIWIRLDFIMLDRRAVELSKIRLLLKSDSMMQYLPEMYRAADGENGFMTRFMSMFDSIFFDMDDRIQKARSTIDYRIADGDMLRYLADWIMTDDAAYLSRDELRQKIQTTAAEYRYTGTKAGLSDWIEREYGVKPEIVEFFNIKKMVREGKDCEVYKRLFGNDPYKFFVLLPEKTFADTHEANIFTERLKDRIPAYTEAAVIILKKNVILDSNTYLDMNSVVNGYSCAESDMGSIGGDIILGGSNDEQQ